MSSQMDIWMPIEVKTFIKYRETMKFINLNIFYISLGIH